MSIIKKKKFHFIYTFIYIECSWIRAEKRVRQFHFASHKPCSQSKRPLHTTSIICTLLHKFNYQITSVDQTPGEVLLVGHTSNGIKADRT